MTYTKELKKRLKVWPLMVHRQWLPLLLSILVVDAGLPRQVSATPRQTSPAVHYRGEAVFRGLFFGDAPVAKLFPEIWESPELAPHVQRLRDPSLASRTEEVKLRLMDRLQSQDPTFFARFGTEVQSGDHLRIQQALEEASQRIIKEVEQLGLNPESAVPSVIDVDIYIEIWAVLVVVAVVAAVVVLVIFLAPEGRRASQASSLKRDMVVDMIASRLGGPGR